MRVVLLIDVLPPGRGSALLRQDAAAETPDGGTTSDGALLIRVR